MREDDFDGDNEQLIASIDALLDLDDAKALAPHGLSGRGAHAYRLLVAARHRLSPMPAPGGGLFAGRWDTYAVCPGCDSKFLAPFGDTRHLRFQVCPHCGEPGARRSGWSPSNWPVRSMRWVPTGRMFRPSTWRTGYWEVRSDV